MYHFVNTYYSSRSISSINIVYDPSFRYDESYRICKLHIQPRKQALDHVNYTGPTRQHYCKIVQLRDISSLRNPDTSKGIDDLSDVIKRFILRNGRYQM